MDPAPVPVAEYPQVLMDVVSELRQKHYDNAAKLCAELDPDLAVTTLASMYAELVQRYERSKGLEPGLLETRIRSEYAAVAAICSDSHVTAPALFGGPKIERHITR